MLKPIVNRVKTFAVEAEEIKDDKQGPGPRPIPSILK